MLMNDPTVNLAQTIAILEDFQLLFKTKSGVIIYFDYDGNQQTLPGDADVQNTNVGY